MPIPSHPIPWDVSHGIPIGMTFAWTSLGLSLGHIYLTHSHPVAIYACPIPWDVSHGIPIGMTFPWTSLGIPNVGVWCKEWFSWTSGVGGGQKIWLRLPVLLGIPLRLVQANSASPGTADPFIKANHVTKTRHAHQVTAARVHILMERAYTEYMSDATTSQAEVLPFEQWAVMRAKQSVQFD